MAIIFFSDRYPLDLRFAVRPSEKLFCLLKYKSFSPLMLTCWIWGTLFTFIFQKIFNLAR